MCDRDLSSHLYCPASFCRALPAFYPCPHFAKADRAWPAFFSCLPLPADQINSEFLPVSQRHQGHSVEIPIAAACSAIASVSGYRFFPGVLYCGFVNLQFSFCLPSSAIFFPLIFYGDRRYLFAMLLIPPGLLRDHLLFFYCSALPGFSIHLWSERGKPFVACALISHHEHHHYPTLQNSIPLHRPHLFPTQKDSSNNKTGRAEANCSPEYLR